MITPDHLERRNGLFVPSTSDVAALIPDPPGIEVQHFGKTPAELLAVHSGVITDEMYPPGGYFKIRVRPGGVLVCVFPSVQMLLEEFEPGDTPEGWARATVGGELTAVRSRHGETKNKNAWRRGYTS